MTPGVTSGMILLIQVSLVAGERFEKSVMPERNRFGFPHWRTGFNKSNFRHAGHPLDFPEKGNRAESLTEGNPDIFPTHEVFFYVVA